MDFSFDNINSLLSSTKESDEIKITDIPCIDLYMDQVTTLFNDKLSKQKRKNEDAVLTKTMINNYAKAKILPPIKNKKYNKQQIVLLILIYNLKQILSLEDIKALFDPILERISKEPSNTEFLDLLYSRFLSEKKQQSTILVDDFIKDISNSLDMNSLSSDDRNSELFMRILTLIANASIQKRMAEKLIDEYFKSK